MTNAPNVELPAPKSKAKASTSADSTANSIRQSMLSQMDSNRRRFMIDNAALFIIPRDKLLIEKIAEVLTERLPPAEAAANIATLKSSYAERKVQKGNRTGEEPRGMTSDYRYAGGKIFCFVGEENLDDHGDWDLHGSRLWRVLVHELGHAVYRTLSDAEHEELKILAIRYYADRPDPKDRYHDGDENEFFAVEGEVLFDVHQIAPYKKGWSPQTAPKKLAPMLHFLERVYGPARNIRRP